MVRNNAWKTDLDLLTKKQLARYEDSLDVLRMMRLGTSFSKASKTVGISPPTTKKFLGKTITTKNNKVIARKSDTLLRKLRIYEKGKEVFIQVKGSKRSKKIGQYHSAIGQRLDRDNKKSLNSFKGIFIKDSKGKIHRFETDIDSIIEIFERREDPEFFTIYKRS